jgi:hypothetical protein
VADVLSAARRMHRACPCGGYLGTTMLLISEGIVRATVV